MNTELEAFISSLNEQEKQTLRERLDRDPTSNRGNGSDRPARNLGWARGKIRIASDFDEPLEDFREYME